MKRFVAVRSEEVERLLSWSGNCVDGIFQDDDTDHSVSAEWVEGGLSVFLGDRAFFIECLGSKRYRIDGREMQLDLRTELEHRFADFGAVGDDLQSRGLEVPMPGRIVKILVKPGDEVVSGQGLVIVEAMKMENELKATHSALISNICVQEGESVEKGTLLVEFE
jgi:acetyl/propionyl-CoA carboxylase alpha subunit